MFDVVSHDFLKKRNELTFKYMCKALDRMVKLYRMLLLKSATPIVEYPKIMSLALSYTVVFRNLDENIMGTWRQLIQ